MTPRMVEALSAAELADLKGGLKRTPQGWFAEGTITCFSSRTLDALVDRGYLSTFGGGRGLPLYRVLTDAGRKALDEWRAAR